MELSATIDPPTDLRVKPKLPTPALPPGLLRHVRPTDLPAAVDLATRATTDVIDITEGVHQAVRRTLGLPEGDRHGRTSGLPGLVYRGVRATTNLVGGGAAALITRLLPWLDDPASHPPPSRKREAVIAALNGVMGDRLRATGNALAQPMELRLADGQVLPIDQPEALRAALAEARPRLLLLAHGLCMNEHAWQRGGQDLGQYLAAELDATPIYLRYNTGLHTSTNGRELAARLEQLAHAWPQPPERIALIGHSMGGLVLRSAQAYGAEAGHGWIAALRHLVFLATPHHGAPLERAGQGLHAVLSSTPWSAPFTRLRRLHSAGITDLRHGNVLDADWQGRGRFGPGEDRRTPLPLPPGVACYAVAATLARARSPLADRLTGDGLVPLRSALGEHDEPTRRLRFGKANQWIAWRTGHLELLARPALAERVRDWLSADTATDD